MLDYKGFEALYTVINLQSFELAAKKLLITQSAISQRIKGLEEIFRAPLLVRVLPYRPTGLGKQLLTHFKKISLLESALKKDIEASQAKQEIAVAINRDSLETWFLKLVGENNELFSDLQLEILADDQELTLDYFKNGKVSACVSTSGKEIAGGKAAFLGYMDYVLAASPTFVKKYFSKQTDIQSLLDAPAIKFDHQDNLHERYLEKFFGIDASECHFHVVPSVRGFKEFALHGFGYGLIPLIDMEKELRTKQLIIWLCSLP
ncbi:MAG: ArgP/LysG family DNA-binding transcriptional regulator [Parachlamydia sp.]|jgi:LysR family transcriptional regulator (chromosome initiation inhibitor)|nr:ArgP/LysG family DNA-binding transcriptional regulator [Parachlamydia sp.]